MRILRNLIVAVLMTLVTTALFGFGYPLVVTGLAQWLFPAQANGSLIVRDGRVIGSRLLGQPFTADRYFHPRPSAAGPAGYDPTASGGTNLGPTSKALIDAVRARVAAAQKDNPGTPVPVGLVTSSGSGLDPDLSPASALFQVPRVARARGASDAAIRALVESHIDGRQLGFLGEARVNVLELNLALDAQFPTRR
jgi:potassium-transporting ATPase KdpC subunit